MTMTISTKNWPHMMPNSVIHSHNMLQYVIWLSNNWLVRNQLITNLSFSHDGMFYENAHWSVFYYCYCIMYRIKSCTNWGNHNPFPIYYKYPQFMDLRTKAMDLCLWSWDKTTIETIKTSHRVCKEHIQWFWFAKLFTRPDAA